MQAVLFNPVRKRRPESFVQAPGLPVLRIRLIASLRARVPHSRLYSYLPCPLSPAGNM